MTSRHESPNTLNNLSKVLVKNKALKPYTPPSMNCRPPAPLGPSYFIMKHRGQAVPEKPPSMNSMNKHLYIILLFIFIFISNEMVLRNDNLVASIFFFTTYTKINIYFFI